MSYTIKQKFIIRNHSNTALVAKGIVLHETATPGATAEDEYNYFNNADRNASAHAFVDFNEIIQTVPWGEVSWHAGNTANNRFLGIELCHFDDKVKFTAIWKRATWLFAHLLVHVVKVKNVATANLMSHAEVSAKWHESTHNDPISYFASHGKTVAAFRADVQKQMNIMLAPPKPKFVEIAIGKRNDPSRVKKVQIALNKIGYKCLVDGIYGQITESLVTQFQESKKLGVKRLGVIGEKTWKALVK